MCKVTTRAASRVAGSTIVPAWRTRLGSTIGASSASGQSAVTNQVPPLKSPARLL